MYTTECRAATRYNTQVRQTSPNTIRVCRTSTQRTDAAVLQERYIPSVAMAQSVVIASAMEDPAVNVEGTHVVGVQTGVDTVTAQHLAAPWGVPFVVHLGSGHGQSTRHDTPHGFRPIEHMSLSVLYDFYIIVCTLRLSCLLQQSLHNMCVC